MSVSSGDHPQLVVTAAARNSDHILQPRSRQPTSVRMSQDEDHTWFVGVHVP